MRLFIAIVPPARIRERLASAREALRQTGADVKWVETENIHITLKFLGNVDASRLTSIQETLSQAAAPYRPFRLGFKGCGVFPNRRRPRVVWIDTLGDVDMLRALQADVELAFEPLGFAREARGFSPHVTLGRARSDSGAARLVEKLTSLEKQEFGTMDVVTVSLMESQLSRQGPIYRHVHDVPFGRKENSV